ncbi:MAG: hypothetical protein HZC40_21765 [Chloroflexi bacterium]|nr:hypothetical protein [Chloroflexota bacterium]
MGIVFMIHSLVRWVILLVAVIAAIKFAIGWLQKQKPAAMDRGLMSGFSGLMDLQALLGIVFLLVTGFGGIGFPMERIEHAFAMLVATVVAHLPMRWRNADSTNVLRNNLFVVIAVVAIVMVGIASLPSK